MTLALMAFAALGSWALTRMAAEYRRDVERANWQRQWAGERTALIASMHDQYHALKAERDQLREAYEQEAAEFVIERERLAEQLAETRRYRDSHERLIRQHATRQTELDTQAADLNHYATLLQAERDGIQPAARGYGHAAARN